jgi:hypothetical protein
VITNDLLAKAAEEKSKRTCKHPHLKSERQGKVLRCIDCNAYYLLGWVAPETGETLMYDFMSQSQIPDGSHWHAPDEAPRTKPKTK